MVHLRFKIHYATAFGSNVCITGDNELGKWGEPVTMTHNDGGLWVYDVEVDSKSKALAYKYLVTEGNGNTLWEGGENRNIDPSALPSDSVVEVFDSWRDISSPEATYFASNIFREVVFGRHESKATKAAPLNGKVPADHVLARFEVVCSTVSPNCRIYLSGSCATLGRWEANQALELSDAEAPYWRLTLPIPRSELPFSYKYVIVDDTRNKYRWEQGDNRGNFISKSGTIHFNTSSGPDVKVVLFNDYEFRFPFKWRGAGVAVPVFSLRTKNGLGIGEFPDIELLVDWAVKAGLNMIQILPISDTTVFKDYRDSYPYSALSVHALHPVYLNLEAMTDDKAILAEVAAKKQVLNKLKEIDYEEVTKVKQELFKRIFETKKAALEKDGKFQQFVKENQEWLPAYALFCHFRDHYGTTDFSKWGENSVITKEKITAQTDPKSPIYNSILFSYFLQFHLDKQLLHATQYAAQKRVGIKGDLPIGVNRFSVDTWVAPHLFRMNMSTGAPPDAFSDDGQNWGFPTYAWEVMAKDGYAWWKSRLGQMQKYFHAFRIDHILGFFRIWEIPGNQVTGLLGRFNPSIPIWRWELNNAGIQDVDRLCSPYIRAHHLNLYFGNQANYAAEHFLDEYQPMCYHLKPAYATEKSVVQNLTKEEQSFKTGLFRLIQNVVLLRHDGEGSGQAGERFYPRIDVWKTPSFQELDSGLQENIKRLYISYFYERQEEEWRQIGLERLPAIKNASKMLVCGEDLGMVPQCVEPVLNQLGILGLRIQRMPADPKIEFYNPADYQYLSVCTTSSHDMPTLRGWWEDDRVRSQRIYNDILTMFGEAPYYCEPYVTQSVLHQHFHSPSMWAIFPIQDFMGLSPELSQRDPKEEKINEPANPLHYWRYRMHVGIEEILEDHSKWTELLHFLVQSSGRSIN
eukprot:TRINITY_DN1956_c0_g1_i2.p1 TRINITY_DN1956_c0_g1~~TRINITY_DN1956_c0_g1_i2.p1  ORF type:complete len:914 (-),score=288.35 TRINITY_DN1956_c0_g1_i2:76-2817(-)